MNEKDFKFFIAVPVWGRSYVDLFLNVSLASLMTEDNLPFLCKSSTVSISIYTTQEFFEEISQNILIRSLSQIADVCIEILYTPIKEQYNSEQYSHNYHQALYQAKSNSYRDNLYKAKLCKNGTKVMVSLNADIVFAKDFMKQSYEILLTGKKVIEVVGPRGKAQNIKTELQNRYYDPITKTINISSKELLNLWVDNIHPLLDIHFWNGTSDHFNCSHIMWPLPDNKGWLARCFFLYPILLVIPEQDVNFSWTIDGDLVTNCGYTRNDSEIITNNEKLFCCELSESDKYAGAFGVRGDLQNIASVYKRFGKTYNIDLLKEKIILGCGVDNKKLDKIAFESDQVINNILNLV